MPLLTVLAPETRVEVEGMALPGARIETVTVRSGATPLVYGIKWQEPGGPVRRCSFRGDRVTMAEEQDAVAVPGSGKLANLGRMMADQITGRG